ncbi:OLC1v1009427C2 [Oldenlandia corymbosa var. corymbosa]|uniref:OLC1v1009427C2 n=1 Tax=Oldenlandia corymbosa var. corymbosa TaxID=529605 RepID=A0AAV1DNW2_OLDCO|nr:OLC1v1009427C2 [Oldenlandia corymbosa var. corymbosa]
MDHPQNAADNLNSSRQHSAESENPPIVYDTTDAISYMRKVRDTYLDQKEKYDAFIDLMREYKDKRVDNPGVIAGLKKLFVEHPNLLLGFNKFLPLGFEITLDNEEEVTPDELIGEYEDNEEEVTPDELKRGYEEAVGFVDKIKERFGSNHPTYTSFEDHLDAYKDGAKSIDELYREVAALFKDHPDLLAEFTKYIQED